MPTLLPIRLAIPILAQDAFSSLDPLFLINGPVTPLHSFVHGSRNSIRLGRCDFLDLQVFHVSHSYAGGG